MPARRASFLKLDSGALHQNFLATAGNVWMPRISKQRSHQADHAAADIGSAVRPALSNLIRVGSRRWFLQAGLAGLGGLSLANLNPLRAGTFAANPANRDTKSVTLIWLSGGPSHI